jgi:folate-dependent tRNA-U54 methylase TrmFO/GidA
MNANFGLVDDPPAIRDKQLKREKIAERAMADMQRWADELLAVPTL